MSDWLAHLSTDATDFMNDTRRLTLYRRGDPGHQIVGWHPETGTAIVEPVEAGARLRPGFAIPAEALDSLRDQLRPGPTERELAQMREALDFERARVDRMLSDADLLVRHITEQARPVPAVLESFQSDVPKGGAAVLGGVEQLDRAELRRIAQGLADLRFALASTDNGVPVEANDRLANLISDLRQTAGPA